MTGYQRVQNAVYHNFIVMDIFSGKRRPVPITLTLQNIKFTL